MNNNMNKLDQVTRIERRYRDYYEEFLEENPDFQREVTMTLDEVMAKFLDACEVCILTKSSGLDDVFYAMLYFLFNPYPYKDGLCNDIILGRNPFRRFFGGMGMPSVPELDGRTYVALEEDEDE